VFNDSEKGAGQRSEREGGFALCYGLFHPLFFRRRFNAAKYGLKARTTDFRISEILVNLNRPGCIKSILGQAVPILLPDYLTLKI
jgi:hypothetical protein